MTERHPDPSELDPAGEPGAEAPGADRPEDATVIPVGGGHENAAQGGYDVVVGEAMDGTGVTSSASSFTRIRVLWRGESRW